MPVIAPLCPLPCRCEPNAPDAAVVGIGLALDEPRILQSVDAGACSSTTVVEVIGDSVWMVGPNSAR